MSTNAFLISRTTTGSYIAARLQFDGFPEHVLPILQTHYVEPESVESLLALGEIRCLDAATGDAQVYTDASPSLTAQRLDLILATAARRVVSHLYLFEAGRWLHIPVATASS